MVCISLVSFFWNSENSNGNLLLQIQTVFFIYLSQSNGGRRVPEFTEWNSIQINSADLVVKFVLNVQVNTPIITPFPQIFVMKLYLLLVSQQLHLMYEPNWPIEAPHQLANAHKLFVHQISLLLQLVV